jgi:hypothetical protein
MNNPSKDLSYKLWKKEADYIDNEIRYNERQRFFSQTWDYFVVFWVLLPCASFD